MSGNRDPLDVLAASVPGPQSPPTGESEGAAAEAIRTAETALAQQNSLVAQVDLQVVTAVLNAHTNHAGGVAALQRLQDEIEGAVVTRTDLDTPAGAREFQRYLLDKLRDIRALVDAADLDATSQATLAAALASLYASVAPAATESPIPDSPSGAGPTSPGTDADPPVDADPLADAGPLADASPAFLPAPGMAATAPGAVPAAWGSGAPAANTPFGGSLPTLPTAGSPDAGSPIFGLPDPPADWPDEKPGRDQVPEPVPDGPADADSDADGLTVTLPDGQAVTASSPQLAAAIADAVGGTPIRDAFSAEGIILPPPGSDVLVPVEPARLLPGDIGLFSDRYALALGNGQMLLDNVIQPVAAITEPGFIGWQQPPVPTAPNPNDQTAAG